MKDLNSSILYSLVFFTCTFSLLSCKDDDVSDSKGGGIWQQIDALPGPQRAHTFEFVIGDRAYIGGGVNFDSYRDDFFRFDPSNDSWEKLGTLPIKVAYAVGFSINGKGYFATGQNEMQAELNDVWEYDPATETWTQKNDFPGSSRYLATGLAIGEKGYLGMGFHLFDIGDQRTLNDWWEYDPATDTWVEKAEFYGGKSNNGIGITLDGNGYVGMTDFSKSHGNEWWKYNPVSDEWTQLPNFPGKPRTGAAAFSAGGKIVTGGGYDPDTGASEDGTLIDWYALDTENRKWSQVLGPNDPNPRVHTSDFSLNGAGYYGMGKDGRPFTSTYFNGFYRFTFE